MSEPYPRRLHADTNLIVFLVNEFSLTRNIAAFQFCKSSPQTHVILLCAAKCCFRNCYVWSYLKFYFSFTHFKTISKTHSHIYHVASTPVFSHSEIFPFRDHLCCELFKLNSSQQRWWIYIYFFMSKGSLKCLMTNISLLTSDGCSLVCLKTQ